MMKPEHSYKKRVDAGSAAGNGLSRGTIINQVKGTLCSAWKCSASSDTD